MINCNFEKCENIFWNEYIRVSESEAVVDWNKTDSQNNNTDTSPMITMLTEASLLGIETAQTNLLCGTEIFTQNNEKDSK